MKLLKQNMDNIVRLCRTHTVSKLFAFGSVLRETFNDKSDLDLIVDFEENGRAAYYPGALLRLFIYGYLNRIGSSRQLEKLKARPFFGHFIGNLRHSGFLGW
jgi:hypothetical protein